MPVPSAPATTRDRLVATTAALFLHQGFTATGVGAITAGSGVPTGSLYHHFPGGKDQLAAEALRVAGAGYGLLVGAVIDDAPDLATGIRQSFPAAAAMLEASGYADACPIATVALEVASTNDPLRQVTHEVFESWATALSSRLEGAGLAAGRSRALALTYLAALEGAFLLCRASRSPEAMVAVGAVVADAVDAALAEVR